MTSRRSRSWPAMAVLVAVTALSAWLTATRLRVSTDLSVLFPRSGEAAALGRWNRAFSGRDPALVLVRGLDAAEVERATATLAERLRASPSIVRVLDRAPTPPQPPDPTLAWAYAGASARARLAQLVTPEGMRARLAETRALLLAPAADDEAESWLARDPLRLLQVPWAARAELAGGVGAPAGAPFVADAGRARLVVAQPRGSAFRSADVHAAMDAIEGAVRDAARPGVVMEVAGGHAIAAATEAMLKRDLALSGTLSLVFASLAFVATFRRVRALAAVLPPLIVGTVWTTGLAALFPAGLNAIAIAFAAVVVGVGVDTGVHVYAALLDARRDGLAGGAAARRARDATWTPTLTAAAVAAVAFASLGLSGLRAMQELGLLCGAGELLTAVAILLLTPVVGAWLERGPPPPPLGGSRWIAWLGHATATRRRAAFALVGCAVPIAVLAAAGWPKPADALVAVRPSGLAPLVAEEHVRALFGGHPGQWFVLSVDRDEESARARADRVAEALEKLEAARDIDGFDALATFAPSATTQRARLAERDALDLPSRRGAFEATLADVGFSVDACRSALDAFAHPAPLPDGAAPTDAAASSDATSAAPSDAAPRGHVPGGGPADARAWLFARHVARDGADTLVVTYVRPTGVAAADARARSAIHAADPTALVTGFDAIDRALRASLDRDLVLVGGVALGVVAMAMRVALHSARHALVALATLACEMGAVGVAMRLLSVQWHVYDALVLPVLFGVTIDESMFLLHAARERPMIDALRAQGPLVAATALTTAAGFAALLACRFDGLRDLGEVGAIGVLAGLAAALVVVPAAVQVFAPAPGGARADEPARPDDPASTAAAASRPPPAPPRQRPR